MDQRQKLQFRIAYRKKLREFILNAFRMYEDIKNEIEEAPCECGDLKDFYDEPRKLKEEAHRLREQL